MNNKIIASIAAVIGAVLLVIGVMYLMVAASSYPSFMPGYDMVSLLPRPKHGYAALLLGVIALAFAWFWGGKKKSQRAIRPGKLGNFS